MPGRSTRIRRARLGQSRSCRTDAWAKLAARVICSGGSLYFFDVRLCSCPSAAKGNDVARPSLLISPNVIALIYVTAGSLALRCARFQAT